MNIKFEAKLLKIGPLKLTKVPLNSSKEFSSRGMVMVKGTINNIDFKTPLEPDGKGSHWIEVNTLLSKEIGVDVGETVSVTMEQTDDWIEPTIPKSIVDAMTHADVLNQWNSITTRSRWEWIRWIRSTKSEKTRTKRMNVACSKLQNGDKNPCCFNASLCTVTDVSKSGVLLDT